MKRFLGKTEGWGIEWGLRYTPVVEIIKKKGEAVLEIGCGSGLGLNNYLDRKIFGVDLMFNQGTDKTLLIPVAASSISLPFRDMTFDIITAVDVIEHIEASKRQDAINEMVRVVKGDGTLILSIPCDKYAEACDISVNRRYKKRTGSDHSFLLEHIANSFPSKDEIKGIFDHLPANRAGGGLMILENTNIYINTFIQNLLLGDIDKPINLTLRVLLKVMSPVLRYVGNIGRCYRKIFIFKRASQQIPYVRN